MTDRRCDCCDLLIESCGKAIEQRRRAEEAEVRRSLTFSRLFVASYHGRCDWCDEHIEPGNRMAYAADDSKVCERCAK